MVGRADVGAHLKNKPLNNERQGNKKDKKSKNNKTFVYFVLFAFFASLLPSPCLALSESGWSLFLLQFRERGEHLIAVFGDLYTGKNLRDFALRVNDKGVARRQLGAVVFHNRAVGG